MKVGIVGGSGYVGGELTRLLLNHPKVNSLQVTSESLQGKSLSAAHPNLRKKTNLRFISIDKLKECDFLFLSLPHGASMHKIDEFFSIAPNIIDLSSDFRLKDPKDYQKRYGIEHPNASLLPKFIYGIPEIHREEMREACWVSGAGCLATASILALMPLFRYDLLKEPPMVVIEGKIGSSAAGNKPTESSHHPERSGVVRSFQPTGHRHTAEIIQELSFFRRPEIYFSATAIDMVRGILITAHCFPKEGLTEKDIWKVYRQQYEDEPFIRIVKEKKGIYRLPEPKILAGSNYCDIGFEMDEQGKRLVVMAAIDNLMKGGAGNAVQAMNIMAGFEETLGLEFPGLHPC